MELKPKYLAMLYGLLLGNALAGTTAFITPMDKSTWQMNGNPIRCGLSVTVPNYGTGYFEQYAAKPPHFVFRNWDHVVRTMRVRLYIQNPVWKPRIAPLLIATLNINPGAYGIHLRRQSALRLLNFLSRGYEASFNYPSDVGGAVRVALNPVGFQKAYSRYQKCVGHLLSFGYEQVKTSLFHFGSDSFDLNEVDKKQLRRIAQYTEADGQIQMIKVIGYADDSGRKGYNNAISQFRAQAVENYLLDLGVPKDKLSVTWLGALKPIARNDTDAGRAANRRVAIDLIKK